MVAAAPNLANNDANDGYVKANATGGSAAVGSFANMAIGRGTDSLFSRTVLSFDTSVIPDAATVTRAYVTVTWSSGSGDPWANPAGNTLVVDVKSGCFGACTIESGDWAAAPGAAAVATIAKFTSGTKQSTDFAVRRPRRRLEDRHDAAEAALLREPERHELSVHPQRCPRDAPRGVVLGDVAVEPLGELERTGQCGQVAAIHLVGRDAEALSHDAALELGREEPIVAAEQEPRGDVGPRVEGPGFLEGRARLSSDVVGRLCREIGRDVVEEQRLHVVVIDRTQALALGVARAVPARGRCSPTSRRVTRLAAAPSPRPG